MNTEETIKNLFGYISDECAKIDREERFDAMLDECYSFEKVGGPFEHMLPSRVLKENDPTAYRCGVNDWADGERWVEIDGDYYDQDEVEKARGEFTLELENKAQEIESYIEELEADSESENDEIAELEADSESENDEIAEKRDELSMIRVQIEAVEKYVF